MRNEMPNPPEGGRNEIPPSMLPSTRMGSPLNKMLKKDTRIPEGKEWVADLIREIPVNQLEIVAEFLKKIPPDQAEAAARKLFEIITSLTDGILRAPDQKGTLEYCIHKVEDQLKN